MRKKIDAYRPKDKIVNLLRWNDALGAYDAGYMIEKPEPLSKYALPNILIRTQSPRSSSSQRGNCYDYHAPHCSCCYGIYNWKNKVNN